MVVFETCHGPAVDLVHDFLTVKMGPNVRPPWLISLGIDSERRERTKEGGIAAGGFVEGARGCWDVRWLPESVYFIIL